MENNTEIVQDPSIWSPRDRIFAALYIKTLNVVDACSQIGIQAHVGYNMLKKPHVNEYITSVLSQKIMSSMQVESAIGKIAAGDISDLLDIDESGFPRLNFKKMAERGTLGNIKKIKYDSEGRPEVELYDKMKALEILAKRHGLLKDVMEVKGNIDININAVRATMQAAMQEAGNGDTGRLVAMIDLAEQLAAKRLPASPEGA